MFHWSAPKSCTHLNIDSVKVCRIELFKDSFSKVIDGYTQLAEVNREKACTIRSMRICRLLTSFCTELIGRCLLGREKMDRQLWIFHGVLNLQVFIREVCFLITGNWLGSWFTRIQYNHHGMILSPFCKTNSFFTAISFTGSQPTPFLATSSSPLWVFHNTDLNGQTNSVGCLAHLHDMHCGCALHQWIRWFVALFHCDRLIHHFFLLI